MLHARHDADNAEPWRGPRGTGRLGTTPDEGPARLFTRSAGPSVVERRGAVVTTTEPHLIRRRMRFERDYTQLPNRWLRDERLSYRARGLLALLMTHEHGWKVTLKALAGASPDGIDAVRSGALELEQHGYLVRHPVRRGGRFTGDHWELVDPFELVDNVPLTALDNPTRPATALANPTRTALDYPTPIEDQKKTSKTYRGDRTRGRGPTCGQPAAAALAHLYVDDQAATCEVCGLSRDGSYRVDVVTGGRL